VRRFGQLFVTGNTPGYAAHISRPRTFAKSLNRHPFHSVAEAITRRVVKLIRPAKPCHGQNS
jgi:hypothetical protein